MAVITLTSDFGLEDAYVGTLKGVILSRAPRVRIVDLTHAVGPGDVRAGAFALASAARFFPPRTIHVVVVDPGVGSERPAVAIRTSRFGFVGPDNGVLSWALEEEEVREVRRVENTRLFVEEVSATFHGRDVFAPVAAWLATGGGWAAVGPKTEKWERLERPRSQRTAKGWRGAVVYVDRFGNAITNLDLKRARAHRELRLPGGEVCSLGRCYQSVPRGQGVVVPGSSGYLEIAVNGGSAARRFGLKAGDRVWLPEKSRSR